MSNLRALAIYGHPDDEGQVTGTLARLIDRGAAVTLLCATRGEVGEISDPSLATPDTLGYVRELELRAAMAQVGLFDVRFLPFRDSGMAGTPENDDPRCFHQQPDDVAVGHVVAVMRDVRPHAVFTWDASGGYGHPDHIAAHRHTKAAFEAAADPAAYPEAGAPWQPSRLYWGAFTMKRFASVFLELESKGLLPEPMEPERRERFLAAMDEPDPPISLVHDTRDLAGRKRAAASMHRSQFGESSVFARMPDEIRDRFFGEERFYQASPAWDDAREPEFGLDALFALAAGA
jgi:N-acetyl-1-D-myo-inositol-2-amino-2-deoxy-alpha-D-glucopyranoside deacetylase